VASQTQSRPDPPLLAASTLLVPGYIDRNEVREIAEFVASLDPTIPYSLLAFHPQFEMRDLPFTTREEAHACAEAAKAAGLTRVRIGNVGLLR
jgi:pyruvate formate lyase activating enzyme